MERTVGTSLVCVYLACIQWWSEFMAVMVNLKKCKIINLHCLSRLPFLAHQDD